MLYRSPPHTHWGALAFTLAIAVAIPVVVTQTLSIDLVGVGGTTERAQRPTATTAPVASSVPPPPASALDAQLLSQTLPPVIFVGDTTRITLLFRNTGTAPWIKGTAAEARLGIVGDDVSFFSLGMAVNWLGPNRPAVQSEARVDPGQAGTFSFDVNGIKAGRYAIPLGVVVDGVVWLEDGVKLDLTVRQ